MTILKYRGAVSGSLVGPDKWGVQRFPLNSVQKHVDEAVSALDKGEALYGTFFDANNPDHPSTIRNKTATHRIHEIYYMGGHIRVVIEFMDNPNGKIALGYAHIVGLEPVLRVEEGEKPSFDLVMTLEGHHHEN